jgi:DnaJ like chaperone protein
MGIIGKFIGGTLGFALGGPLGAIAGAAFGHAFDRDGTERGYQDVLRLSTGQEAQVTFFVAAFSMLARISKADGNITSAEIDSIQKFMVQELNLSPQNRKIAMDIFHAANQSPERFSDFAAQFHQQFRSQPQMLELMVDVLLRVSLADGGLHPKEEALIEEAVHIFNIGPDHYANIKRRYVRDTGKHYAILGCSPGDSNEHLKSQYRKLMFDFHPDRIQSKGLPEEFTKFANNKFREIQEAYESIKQERGLK